MDITIISKRYAQALFDLAIEMNKLERISEDMKLVSKVTNENPQLRRLLASPIISIGKKLIILKKIFEKHLDILSFRFIRLVTRKEREIYLQNITDNFDILYKKYKNILTVHLQTAYRIDEATISKLQIIAGQKVKMNIEMIEKTDKSLIGGFIMNIGDYRYDASLKKKFKLLSETFSKNLYIREF